MSGAVRLRRAAALAVALVLCVLRFWLARLRRPFTLERRALWVQASARRVLAALGIAVRVQGPPPAHGLAVSNHLSYLDVVAFSSVMPCFFVSKAEVRRWPFFGKAARSGGTIFLDRASRASAQAVARQIAERLTLPVPVLLFPEGTSTDGAQVLRFHSRLIDPAVQCAAPVTACAIRYAPAPRTHIAERDLCWYGDQAFLPHLWKVLGLAGFSAEIHFGEPRVYAHRHAAAVETHAEVAAMRCGAQMARRQAAS